MAKSKITLQEAISPSSSVVFTRLSDGEAVLLHLKSKLYYSLNSSGCFMWELLEQEKAKNPQELAKHLIQHYEIPEETANQDACEFAEDLLCEDLLSKS